MATQTYNFWNTPWNEVPAVYRIADASGRVIYVGQTDNLRRRMDEHRIQPHAIHRFGPALVSAEIIPDLDGRLSRERLLIATLQPPANDRLR